ncbi:MAG: AAA family ATPase [Chloroflexi bacterium]|nr:AAA family ATPase [Chloroflexota bacterium]
MAVFQIVGNQSGAGKTSLAAALLVRANAAGKQAAYYKPFSDGRTTDADVAFISGLLQSLGGPAVPAPGNRSEAGDLSKAQAEVSRLESETGIVVIEGPDGSAPYAIDSKVILVHRYSKDAVAASIASAGPDLAAIVVNAVPIHRRDEAARELAGQSIPVAVIPESRGMLTVTVEQLAEHLGGQWVLDPVNIDAPVERFMIGGNIMDEGPTYFGRYVNQAVITRVERPDIQMACMGEKTCCLVLTGPGEPSEYIKAEALQREVPLIQVRTNTLDTVEALAGLLDKADARTATKASHFAGLLEKYMGAEALEQLLS